VYLENIKLSARDSKFSKIMIAIDGSEHSLKAAEYALDINTIAHSINKTGKAKTFFRPSQLR
jgi:hypothetical protein